MVRKLMPGDRVTIYQRPLTDEDPEGVATLVEFDSASEGYGTERWFVRFDGESETWPRDVRTANRVME